MKKIVSMIIAAMLAVICLVGCSGDGGQSSSSSKPSSSVPDSSFNDSSAQQEVKVYPISYEQVNNESDMQKFFAQTRTVIDNVDQSHDGKLDYGFVNSVWHEMTVNGEKVAVYSARCGSGIHSFAWVDVQAEGDFQLDVTVKYLGSDTKSSIVVLPEKSGVKASLQNNVATASICDYGSFSFVYDESPDNAVTLYVAPESKLEVSSSQTVVNIEPGTYTAEETSFSQTNTVYVFKSGVYDVTSIVLPSDSTIYFERGCYLRIYENGERDHLAAFSASGKNSKILGRAIVDFSNVTGGTSKTKGAYSFDKVENFEVEGLISINSHNWTMCTTLGNNATISRCMFFGYRTFSDGIMFSDCKNCLATDNFVRTGDDAAEVKAFSQSADEDCYTENVVFENNCVWTDKGIAYGCIYESKHDVKGVIFRNNSVGFAQASWSEHLGCITMQMGSVKEAVWENVHFENTEIYQTSCATVSIYNKAQAQAEGGTIRKIYVNGVTVKRTKQTNLPVYCLSVVMITGKNVDKSNVKIGAIYLDNIDYCGTTIDSDNYKEFANFNIGEGISFSKSNIKIGTIEE